MPAWLSAVAGIAALAGILGIAYAVFTSARVQKTLELYKEENAAQGKRIDSLEKERNVATERIAALERENVVLRDLATGRSVMEKLAQDVTTNEALRREEHNAMMALLVELKDMIHELWTGMVRFLGGSK
jgi:hypothetical protein